MFKDYYKILGIPETATPEQIKTAYRTQAKMWHPDRNQGKDTTSQMKDINEAYAILNNPESKARYDKEYLFYRYANHGQASQQSSSSTDSDYDFQDDQLKEDIKKARRAAEEYVRDLFSSLKKDTANAANGVWEEAKGYVIVSIIMSVVGLLIATTNTGTRAHDKTEEPVVQIADVIENDNPIPEGWSQYDGGTAYSIAVPPTVELRDASDTYSQALKRLNLNYNSGGIVFQQKGLAHQEQAAYNKYCRIMIQYVRGNYGDFMKATETETLDSEWKSVFDEMVEGCIGPAVRLMGSYTYKWTTINGANCIQIDYRRTGSNYDASIPVVCRIAIFQNDNEMVKMILSYREKEAATWKADFDIVFKSFRWI